MTDQCVFCGIVEDKIGSAKIYEDEFVICILDIFPASKGHMLVIPKKHFSISAQMDADTTAHVFEVVNKMSALLFETLGAEGTNIIVSNGTIAGQKVNHVCVNIIPRYKDDGVNISWKNEQIKEEELKDIFTKITSKGNSVTEEPKEVKIVEEPIQEVVAESEEVKEEVKEEPEDEVLP